MTGITPDPNDWGGFRFSFGYNMRVSGSKNAYSVSSPFQTRLSKAKKIGSRPNTPNINIGSQDHTMVLQLGCPSHTQNLIPSFVE